MRVILGLQEAHDASAALMVDGRIVAAAQEERFTGLKGDYGYPRKAIAACLAQAGFPSSQIDEVALASQSWNPVLTKIKRNANFSVDDWVQEQQEYWKAVLFEKRKVRYYDLFKDRPRFRYDDTYPMDHLLDGYMSSDEMAEMLQIRRRTAGEKLGLPIDRVRAIVHEDCHTFYAYFASHLRGPVLALTSEGIGDYSNGTVSLFDESGRRELAATRGNHLGHLYQYVTLLLGMKPAQHEYKVMGLAPYANEHETAKSYEVFRHVLKVDGLSIVYDRKPTDLYFWFKDRLEGHRFDGIAGAVQKLVEERLTEWVRACHGKTGLSRIVFSGGVAQNIKANKAIAELDCVDDLAVAPAAGDTSLAIGACYAAMWEHCRAHGLSTDLIRPLDDVYLGPSFGDDEAAATIEESGLARRHKVETGVDTAEIARRISFGMVVARCRGRMEFGLRALGNRSILADPRRPDIVWKINSQIKFRDFWMPFTPTLLAEREHDYIVNPKKLRCPNMTLAFDSTPLARRELIAALHPADLTVRPQILERAVNPEYHELIRAFESITGVGGILNTSFNLHGWPIVLGPREAIHVFENSELDALLLGKYLITRSGG